MLLPSRISLASFKIKDRRVLVLRAGAARRGGRCGGGARRGSGGRRAAAELVEAEARELLQLPLFHDDALPDLLALPLQGID